MQWSHYKFFNWLHFPSILSRQTLFFLIQLIVQGLNFYLLLSVVFPTDNCLPLDLVIHLLTRPWNAILATRNTAAVACMQSLFNQVLK